MGSDESHESDEGSERGKGGKGHDSNRRLPVCCRNHWLETEGREGSCGGHGGRSGRSAEKDWLFQDCRCAELEAEAETCNTCAQERQPFHEKPLRFQSQASIKDSESTSDEKAQGVGEHYVCLVRSLFRKQLRAFSGHGGRSRQTEVA